VLFVVSPLLAFSENNKQWRWSTSWNAQITMMENKNNE